MDTIMQKGSSMLQVPSWKLYAIGFALPLFSAWLGLAYALLFIFARETRRMGVIFLVWLLVVFTVALAATYWLTTHGYGSFLR